MKHPDIPLLVATGGPGVVTAVLSSGKRGIGAGAGNPPALVDETGMGNVGDKILKHHLVAEKTPGTEDIKTIAWSGDRGLTLVEMGPFGVIGAITPCTNPSETVLCNTMGMLAGGNTVVFNPHPQAIKTSIYAVNLLNEASLECGGPDNIACTVEKPTLD